MLLKQLIPLGRRKLHTHRILDLDLWEGGDTCDMGAAAVEVLYDVEAASHSDHPYGEGTAREHHPAEIELHSVRLLDDQVCNGKQLHAGTDLMSLPWWEASWSTYLVDTIASELEG
jgi:hypothetical protein